MIYIGIDTGVNTGVAVWDSRKRSLLLVKTMKIHQAMALVKEYADNALMNGTTVLVRVEDPRQRVWYKPMTRDEERKILQGVGSVKRDATIWEDYLKDIGVKFQMVKPSPGMTKHTAERFKALTGWKGRTNEHDRDAAMLVFGF